MPEDMAEEEPTEETRAARARHRRILRASTADAGDAAKMGRDSGFLRRWSQLFGRILREHGAVALQEIGSPVDWTDSPGITRWLEQKAITFADAAFDAYADDVRETVAAGLAAGETEAQIAERLDRDVFDGRKRNAPAVARTESVGTANAGRDEAYRQAGLTEHEWVTTRDDAVRDSHAALDGSVVAIGTPFANGLEFPGDTAHGTPADFVNCRCDLIGVIPGAAMTPWTAERKDAQWRAFDSRLRSDERAVAALFVAYVDEQRRRVLATL